MTNGQLRKVTKQCIWPKKTEINQIKHQGSNQHINYEKILKLSTLFFVGIWVTLAIATAYNYQIMTANVKEFLAPFLSWIIWFSVVFSLFVYFLTGKLVAMLKIKTVQLERQKDNLEELVMLKTIELLKAEKLSAIGELCARISHDIRNPVSIIKNTVEIMKMRHHLDEKTKVDFQRIENAVERISHQVNDVLDYVRDAPLKLEICFISDIINAAISTISFPERIRLKVFQSEIAVMCDPIKIEAVFRNLLLNAIQAIQRDGKISVRVIEKHESLLIELENSGSGIPQDVLPKIFDPLFTTKQQGTGLGLPICKNIIEKHGGKIDVNTTVNRGTTFVIELPKNIRDSHLIKSK
jgi:two-component system sensor histidine kinase HydH